MQKKLLVVCSVFYFVLEVILLVVGLTTKNQESIAFLLNVLIVLCMFGISMFFPIRFNILIRYITLLVLWGIHMAIVIGVDFWDNSSCASIFMGLFAQHFILTIASSLPTERLNLNKYLFFIELFVCLISLSVFPLSIPLVFFKDESVQLIVVGVLGSLTFISEIGIVIFKHFKLELQ